MSDERFSYSLQAIPAIPHEHDVDKNHHSFMNAHHEKITGYFLQ
jgi:hypothetical protein